MNYPVGRALTRILKLPVTFERVPVQNEFKWFKMGLDCIKWSKVAVFCSSKTEVMC